MKNLEMAVGRMKKNLTQKQLAAIVNTKPNYISKLENGISNPSLKMAQKIAKALDVAVDDLFQKEK